MLHMKIKRAVKYSIAYLQDCSSVHFSNIISADYLHADPGHSRFCLVHHTDYLDVENAVTENVCTEN